MQEVKAFNEQRAEIYWWLSSLLSQELSQNELDNYHTPEIRSFLTGLAENPALKQAVDEMITALNRLKDRNDAQLELAADFCQAFLATDKSSALPYASVYLTENKQLHGEPAQKMAALLAEHNVSVGQNFNEPADHIAIQLDFLGHLIIKSNELEKEAHLEDAFVQQAEFLDRHVLSWAPQFSEKCRQVDEFGFYAAVCELVVRFCELDLQYLAKPQ